MPRRVVLHPVTGKYVLCEIQGGVATVIDEYPTFQSSPVQDETPAPAISVNHQETMSAPPPPRNDQVFTETLQMPQVPSVSVNTCPLQAVPAPAVKKEMTFQVTPDMFPSSQVSQLPTTQTKWIQQQ